MIRSIWFLVQLVAVILAAVWLVDQPGTMVVEWMDYKVTLQVGIAFLGLAVIILFALLLYRVFSAVTSIPKFLSRRSEENARQKGFRAMTKGFVAIAAGNAKEATDLAKQTRKLLPGEQGLPLLLEAQAARLRGEEEEARKIFREMLKDRDVSFFGIRGLLKSSMDAMDTVKSLEYARQALDLYPKQPWILRTVYDLEIQCRKWDDALKTARRAVKVGAMPSEQGKKDEIAILLHLAKQDELSTLHEDAARKIEKAYALNKTYIPSVLEILRLYDSKGKSGAVRSIIEKAWKENPHPDYLIYWDRISPENKKTDTMRRLKWYERLLALKPDSVEGQIAVAKAAMDQGLWAAARAYLITAEKIRPTAQIYRLRAEIEKMTTHDEDVVTQWLERASEAPQGKVWFCSLTGMIYDRWSAIAEPHGAFNTIEWGYPKFKGAAMVVHSPEPLLLEPAA